MLEAATKGGSGRNKQPRRVVIRDPAIRRQIGDLYGALWDGLYPPDEVIVEIADPAARRTTQAAADLAHSLGDVPVLILVCADFGPHPHSTPAAGRCASIFPAVQNLLLATRSLGLGTTLTTLHLLREAEIKALLSIPDRVETCCLIALGHPAEPFDPTRRRPVEEATFQDRWGEAFRADV